VQPLSGTLITPQIGKIGAVAGKRRIAQFLRETAEAELLRREASAASGDKPKPRKITPSDKKPKG
jgi:hypothetical protein